MGKTFWAIIAVIVIIFGGIVVFNKKDSGPTSTAAAPTHNVMGGGSTGVTLVEYGDFECSACGKFYPLVEQVKEKYKDKIFFQFRNLPLVTLHPNAFAAARAAEAASKQGKFWEMYNVLYRNQLSWAATSNATATFETYATQLNLKLPQFRTDVASSVTNDIINADINEFKKTKEPMSTPTFFLDGKKIQAASLDEFSQLIDEAIKNKTAQ